MEIKALIAGKAFYEDGPRAGGNWLSGDIADYPDGIIVPIDKPFRWTSADVVRKVKYAACRRFGKKNLKVGHAGTLDPLATGVLLICIGKATRLAESLQKEGKEYLAGISFGATTPSYDLEKPIDHRYPIDGVSEEALKKILPEFLGEQEQIAPLFSAKSVDGVRAYELARRQYREAGRAKTEVMDSFDHTVAETLNRQTIAISEIELVGYSPDGRPAPEAEDAGKDFGPNPRINLADTSDLHLPHADIKVACSKGTYIRALARDIGEALNSGAHLDSLCRTASGPFRVSEALDIRQAIEILSK